MAVTRVTVPADGTWIELTAGAAPAGSWQFTNVGGVSVMVRYQAAAPSQNQLGDLYRPEMGDRPGLAASEFNTRAWAKIEPGSPREGTVLVTAA